MSRARRSSTPIASFFTVFNAHDPAEQTTDRKSSLSAQYVRVLGAARVTTEVALDQATYNGVHPYAGEAPQGSQQVGFRDGFSGLRWTVNSRLTLPQPGHQMVTVGGEFVDNVTQNQWGAYLECSTKSGSGRRLPLQSTAARGSLNW